MPTYVFPHSNIICLTIGPAFFSAAIYLCLARIVVIYSPTCSRLAPRTYTLIFITSDVVALVLQATGGAQAHSANGNTGVDIMIAGLSWQVASMCAFSVLVLDFVWRCRSDRGAWSRDYESARSTLAFKGFLWGRPSPPSFTFRSVPQT